MTDSSCPTMVCRDVQRANHTWPSYCAITPKRTFTNPTYPVVFSTLLTTFESVSLSAPVPSPRRHLTRYCGVLPSHARLRSQVVPQAEAEATATEKPSEKPEKPARKSKYIPWAALLHRTFGFEIVCAKCQSPLRLVALVKNQDTAKKILVAMHLTAGVPTRRRISRMDPLSNM